MIFSDVSEYRQKRFWTKISSGQSFLATKPEKQLHKRRTEWAAVQSIPAIPERTPYFLAS